MHEFIERPVIPQTFIWTLIEFHIQYEYFIQFIPTLRLIWRWIPWNKSKANSKWLASCLSKAHYIIRYIHISFFLPTIKVENKKKKIGIHNTRRSSCSALILHSIRLLFAHIMRANTLLLLCHTHNTHTFASMLWKWKPSLNSWNIIIL